MDLNLNSDTDGSPMHLPSSPILPPSSPSKPSPCEVRPQLTTPSKKSCSMSHPINLHATHTTQHQTQQPPPAASPCRTPPLLMLSLMLSGRVVRLRLTRSASSPKHIAFAYSTCMPARHGNGMQCSCATTWGAPLRHWILSVLMSTILQTTLGGTQSCMSSGAASSVQHS